MTPDCHHTLPNSIKSHDCNKQKLRLGLLTTHRINKSFARDFLRHIGDGRCRKTPTILNIWTMGISPLTMWFVNVPLCNFRVCQCAKSQKVHADQSSTHYLGHK